MEKCFVIMPIGGDATQVKMWRDIYENVFRVRVEASGLGLTCERADDIHESGSVMKQVLLQLHTARIVLADLTGGNPNVFYELGVRHAFGKRSILVGQSPTESPFDTQQYRMLVYKYPIDLTDDFHLRIAGYLSDALNNSNKHDNPVSDLLIASKAVIPRAGIRALKMELEDNLRTAASFQSDRTYIAPSNEEWLKQRGELEGLDPNLFAALDSMYYGIRRWKGIVESGIKPQLGSSEIPEICRGAQIYIPGLIQKLDQILKA